MSRGTRESRATRVAGGVPLLVGVASAMALTGAAFFTVAQAACGEPGSYIRHDTHVALLGGCVDPTDVPGSEPTHREQGSRFDQETGPFRP
ncbi:MAG: hypothetical protein ACRDQW_00505 [Haloechinothrix sp.]